MYYLVELNLSSSDKYRIISVIEPFIPEISESWTHSFGLWAWAHLGPLIMNLDCERLIRGSTPPHLPRLEQWRSVER